MPQTFDVSPGLPPPEQRVRLNRIEVDRADVEKLHRVSQQTGATAAWHRRQALARYLDQFDDSGRPR